MAFATAAEVEMRLGRALTDAESDLVDLVITSVQGLIVEAVDRDDTWADELDPIPATLKLLCIEKAYGAVVNPAGLAQLSETLGAYQHTDTFQRPEDGQTSIVFLSPDERRRARKAVYGTNVHAPRSESIITPAFPRFADDDEPLPMI